MSRRSRDVTTTAILERRRESGLGVACAEAQADGVPCSTPDGDCACCDRAAPSALVPAAAAAAATRRPASRRQLRRS